MEFFTTLQQIIKLKSPKDKIKLFDEFYKIYLSDNMQYNYDQSSLIFTEPSFNQVCNIVDATSMPKRGSLSTTRGKAYLVHSILHIEYSAIDLALDHSYRFKNMPQKYYDDWLEVADDEIRHFLMLESIILNLGYEYGSFDVHSFLFDISQKSLDLVTRMAVVPRYLEASGLDSNPKVMQKLSNIGDEFALEIIDAMNVILKEEVDHVKKGDYWFKWACARDGVDSDTYFDIVEKILPGARKKKAFVNISDRKKAGFSCAELSVLSNESCID